MFKVVKHNGTLEHFKMEIILMTLKSNYWNRTTASKKLGISVKTVKKYVKVLKEHGEEVHDRTGKNRLDFR
jgi:biotin operon repressor